MPSPAARAAATAAATLPSYAVFGGIDRTSASPAAAIASLTKRSSSARKT
jgi:hypothetical protein